MDSTNAGVRFRWMLTGLLGAFALGGAIDLILDQPATLLSFHVLFELGTLSLSLMAIAYLWLGWRNSLETAEQARRDLVAGRAERDAWRSRAEKLLRGLGEEIDRQLRKWKLTPAERGTAILILKGYGHKEIASLQGKSERTVRQHAVAVYRKSGLSGRADLSAFFLEDLLLPIDDEVGPSQAEIRSASGFAPAH